MVNFNNSVIRISISKIKALTWILMSIVMLAALSWALYKILGLPPGFNKTFLLTCITLLLITFLFGAITGIRNLTDNDYGIFIDSKGILINIDPNRGQFIDWEMITGFKIYKPIRGPVSLLIFIKNPDEFLSNVTAFRRFLLKMNKISNKTPISLTSNWLNCSFEELVKVIEVNYKKHSA